MYRVWILGPLDAMRNVNIIVREILRDIVKRMGDGWTWLRIMSNVGFGFSRSLPLS